MQEVETVQSLFILLTQFPPLLRSDITMAHLSKLGNWTQVYTVVSQVPASTQSWLSYHWPLV